MGPSRIDLWRTMFQKLSQITFCLVLGLSQVLTQDQGIRQKVKMVIAKLADFRDNDIPYFLTPEDGECDPSIVTEFPRGLKNLCKGLDEGEEVCICAPKRPCKFASRLRPAGGLEEVKEVLENPQDLEFEKESGNAKWLGRGERTMTF